MKTSIRLMLTALLVSGITYAAAGTPIPSDRANDGGQKLVFASAATTASR